MDHRFHRSWSRVLLLTAVVVGTVSASGTEVVPSYGAVDIAALIGLTAEAIVVADLGTTHVSGAVSALHAAAGLRAQLKTATLAADTASEALAALESAWADHPGDATIALQHQQALELAQGTGDARTQVLAELREVGLSALAPDQAGRLATWLGATSYRVASEFRVVNRSDAHWRDIELALRAEERANRLGTALEDAPAQTLAQVRSEPLVAAARLRLEGQLQQVESLLSALAAQFAPAPEP